MKIFISTVKVLAAFIFILNGSLYSQNVISSVNVSKNAALISTQLTNNTSGSIILKNNSENWMSNKNYLDMSSSNFNYNEMILFNEKVYEFDKEIESWMLDESEWIIAIPDTYNPLDELTLIEEWMFDDNFWIINEEIDENSIEDWMTDNKFWVIVN